MEITRLDSIPLQEEYLVKFWDSFIMENLAEAFHCRVAIYERKSKRKVIGTNAFHIQKSELDHIAEGVVYPALVYRNGVTVCGRHYDVQLADGKHGIYALREEYGCTVCKTKSYIMICLNDKYSKSSEVNDVVMKIGDYLFKKGI